MRSRVRLLINIGLVSGLFAGGAHASTGVCDSNPPTTTTACINAIQMNAGAVVNDIFKDQNGRTAGQLPLFGKLVNVYAGCPQEIFNLCAGHSNPPYDCPMEYTCTTASGAFSQAETFVNALDRQWFQPCRLTNPGFMNVNGKMCPQSWSCVSDGDHSNYLPWFGLIFDLGGPSNKAAIFAENDHGPQPCESLEYTVFLSDNPNAQELILDPKTNGVDPQKWNRAVLSKIFTKGFVEIRPPDPSGHQACGDQAEYSVEEDSFVQVFSLPCGITFRYASIVAGNDGLDFPACAYDSSEAELDAVAGLTESGAAVCPDADHDHFVDCNCPGHPTICDCNDADPTVHPGAPETCDGADKNCDGVPGACSTGFVCYMGNCLTNCTGSGEFDAFCPTGAACTSTDQGKLCVPTDCSMTPCPAGSICDSTTHICTPDCSVIRCPGDQVCYQGQCIDICSAVTCPMGQTCVNGSCESPCTCYAAAAACSANYTCDVSGTMLCEPTACVGVSCPLGQHCATTGMCVGYCDDVVCPGLQHCDVVSGNCVANCGPSVMCDDPLVCNPPDGTCVQKDCLGVICDQGMVCVNGTCSVADDMGMSSTPDLGPSSTGHHSSGCHCDFGGRESGATSALSLMFAFALIVFVRSRRRLI